MKHLLLPFLAACFGLFVAGIGGDAVQRPATVKLGALLTFNSSIGRVAKIAIDAALNDINSDPKVLQGTKLVVQMQDSNCTGLAAVTEALEFMNTDVVAIIGPQSSVVAHVVSHVANVVQVPLLSFAATDPTLSPLQYPFLVQTTQSDLFQMEAIADILYHFQWKQVTAIFINDDYGRNGIACLDDKLQEKGSKFTYKVALPLEATRSNIMELLVQVSRMESRIIVLHVYGDTGLKVFSAARYLGMMTSGYVWITTDWLSSILDSSSPLESNVLDSLQGVVSLRQHTADSRIKRSFASNWSKLIENETGGNFQLNSYGLSAYDTVWMIAHALDAFFKDNGRVSYSNYSRLHVPMGGTSNLKPMVVFDGGKFLLKKILGTNFVGVTGPVQFGSGGSLVRSAYDILNVIGTGFRTVGYWSNKSGLSVLSPESLKFSNVSQSLYSIIWPGKTVTKPRGWVLPNNANELRIGVPNRVIYKEFISIDATTGSAKGYCIDVFSAALNLLPYAVPYRFVPYGDSKKSPSYDELVEMVASNTFDAAVGDITIVTNRTKIVDFTQPFIGSGLVILVPLQDHNKVAWAFLQPFTTQMWLVTVLSFLIVGAVVWILEHRINDEFRGPPRRQLCTILCCDSEVVVVYSGDGTLC